MCAFRPIVFSNLLRNKDLIVTLGPFRWCRSVPLVLSVCAVLASPAYPQQPASRKTDLPVTRLQGGPAQDVVPASGQTPEPRSMDLSSLPVTQLDDRVPAADLDGPRRIALSLGRPMPLQDMLLLLVNGTPFSIVADDAVQGTFIGDLKDLTMRQALEAVLFPRGLDYDVRGTLIRVSAHKPATRLFDANFIDQRRTWQRAAVGSSHPDGVEVLTSGGSDVFDELGDGVKTLLSANGRMHVDRSAGLVQVTDFADRLDQVGAYVEALQLRALRQVRIDVRIFEVTLADPAAASIDWKAAGLRGAGAGGAAGGRTAGMTVVDPEAFIKAIGEQGSVTMIAAPRVLAMNNQPAVLRAGTGSVYSETASYKDEGGRNRRAPSPSALLEGLTLTITPQISGSGTVQLSVAPAYSERTGQARSSVGEIYPVIRVSEADTVVRVRDGDTVVIAGFLHERSRSRPATGLASYFGAQSHETVTCELVILLTPTVVTPATGSAAALR
jgi:type II/III secretion system protein